MQVVVVGSGFGGTKLALELANKTDIEVTLVSTIQNFEYHAALYRSGTGRSPLEVVLPLRTIFQRKNVRLALDKIVGIDPQKQHVVSESGAIYRYDKVVFAMGNVVNYFGLTDMKKSTMTLDTIKNTIALRQELTSLFKSKSKIAKVAVIGAGPAGVELVGELQHFARLVAEKYNLPVTKVKPTLIEGSDRVLPTLDKKASKKALARLKRLKVNVMLNTQVNSCLPGKVCIISGDIDADIIVWTAGSKAVGFYAEHPEIFELERGRVKVDQYLRAIGHDNIYVIGDNAATPFSGMAQTALHDAHFVSKNIMFEVQGKSALWYKAVRPIYAVPIGPKWAILQTKTKVISGYKAWLTRRRADLAIYRNFQPYKQAMKTWRKGNDLARF